MIQDMDDAGFHRLRLGEHVGEWFGYEHLATLEVEGTTYYGATQYWAGKFPESAFTVIGVSSTWKDFGPRGQGE